ncbi:MAG: hypothetical protein ABUL62_03250 [Myxococcales bacterium]
MSRWALGLIVVVIAVAGCGGSAESPDSGAAPGAPTAGADHDSAAGAVSDERGGTGPTGSAGAPSGAGAPGGAGASGGAGPTGGTGPSGGGSFEACTDYPTQLVEPSFTLQLAGACSFNEAVSPGLSYSGPAIVQASTDTELTLMFEQPACAVASGGSAGSSGNAGSAGSGGARPSKIVGDSLPSFPTGARVWLSYKIRTAYPYTVIRVSYAHSVTLRTEQDGTVLFAGSYNDDPPDGPALKVGHEQLLCETTRPDSVHPSCPSLDVRYYSLLAEADTQVMFADGERKTISLGGLEYDALVRDTSVSSQACQGSDYHSELQGGKAVTLRAKNMKALIDALPREPPTL